MKVPRVVWGLGAVILYVAAVAVAGRSTPTRLLFDGLAPPPPYNWVSPPPELAASNKTPLGGSESAELTASGSREINLSTDDGQASIIAPQGTFAARSGQTSVLVTITPEDPATLGPPPEGTFIDGNAYVVEVAYEPSGETAEPGEPISLLLRYPRHSTFLMRWIGQAWTRMETTAVPATLQVFGDTLELGTFVAASETPPSEPGGAPPWLFVLSIGAIVIAAVWGLVDRVRGRRASGSREGRRRQRREPGKP